MHKVQQKLINVLQDVYGKYDPVANQFEQKSNSVIARELFYSDSQFSRLMNGTASDGEYHRAVKVVQRYREYLDLKTSREALPSRHSILRPPMGKRKLSLGLGLVLLFGGLLLGVVASVLFLPNRISGEGVNAQDPPMDYLLKWAFEDADVNPYVHMSDLPEDCAYPCYRLQGQWVLDRPYKIPLFGEQRGFHYVATQANMYARCMSEKDSDGSWLEGFEYQQHEIWYDVMERPIDSFLVAPNSDRLKPEYLGCDLGESEQYILLARVHTFFRDEFHLDRNSIQRNGKVVGRHIEFEDFRSSHAFNQKLENMDLEEGVNQVIRKQVQDFSNPIDCQEVPVDKAYHHFEEGEQLSFSCRMTTGRFPIAYTKVYRLEDQIIKNACRPKAALGVAGE